MYTLLLVDDEEEVIEAIVKKVKWEELGFQVTGHANNGFKAMDMLEEMQPDVVMTDIRMPYMDGLELCAHIKAKYPATKILLFTGFDDFEYAKEAVHLEIEEYILKPLNAVEITEVFKRLKEKLDYEISEKRNTDLLKKYYADSLPMLQANLYTTLIEGRIPEEEMPHYFKDYQIAFTGPWYCCLIIHTSASQVPEGMDIRLLSVSVDRQAGENLGEKWNAKRFRYLGDTIMIMHLKSEEEISELTDACDRFCKYIHHIMGGKSNHRDRSGMWAHCKDCSIVSKRQGSGFLSCFIWKQPGDKFKRDCSTEKNPKGCRRENRTVQCVQKDLPWRK